MSDRPSPRGGGPAAPDRYAVRRARELIAAADSRDLYTEHGMAQWIGRAVIVLTELTRDA